MIKLVSRFSLRTVQIQLLILFSCFTSITGYCQYLDNIIPPSPNSYSFVKYIEHPVSHNTGVPEVSIPLFSWGNHSGLGLNLSLNYHLGGIKVEEIASNVGLGWSLQGLGVVTRSMRGRPDDGTQGFIRTPELPNYNTDIYDGDFPSFQAYSPFYLLSGMGDVPNADFSFLHSLYKNYYDTQQDVFYLSVANLSLKFYIGKDKSILFEEYSNTIINPIYSSFDKIEGFEVIDDEGIKYTFNEMESTYSIDPSGAFNPIPSYTMSWLLTKIEQPTNSGVINIEYEDYTQSYTGSFMETLRIRKNRSEYSTGPTQTIDESSLNIRLSGKRVKGIILPDEGRISFEYDTITPRIDVGHPQNQYGQDNRLQRINVFNKYENDPLYSYEFIHSYFTKTPSTPNSLLKQYVNRLKLDGVRKISEKDQNEIFEDHFFEYYSNTMVPRNSNYQDFWGYSITDGRSMPHRIPKIKDYSSSPSAIHNGVDRTTDPFGVLSGSLKKIIYPTKGYTVYNMEANQAFDDSKDYFFTEEKEYLLTFNQSQSLSTVSMNIDFNSHHTDKHHYLISLEETFREDNPGGPITWIEDHLNNTPINVLIKNEDNTWSKMLYSGTYEQLVNISKLKVFDENVPTAGRYQIEIILGNFRPFPIEFKGVVELTSISNKKETKFVGGLRAKKIQQFDADDQLLLEKEYKYVLQNGQSSGRLGNIPNYDFYRFSNYIYIYRQDGIPPLMPSHTEHWLHRNSFSTLDLGYISNTPVLYTRVEETINDVLGNQNNGSILYEFNPFKYYHKGNTSYVYPFAPGVVDVWTSGKPIKITYRDPIGQSVMIKEFEYENDFSEVDVSKHRSLKLGVVSGSNVLGDMPHETRQYAIYPMHPFVGYSRVKKEVQTMYTGIRGLGGQEIKEIVEYTYDAKKQVKQEKQISSDGKISTEINYYPYDYLNCTPYQILVNSNRIGSYVQKDILRGSLLNPDARIREFKNYKMYPDPLDHQRQHHPRYEGTYLDYKNGASTANVDPRELESSYKTVAKVISYDVFGNPLEVKNDDLTTVYLWGYGGQYLIAKIDNATYAEVVLALATPPEKVIDSLNQTNVSDATINLHVQGLRTNLTKALVTSYTYKPLIGLTSITDARGATEYYQYDGFGRLQTVLDQDENIIRTYCYNYIGQQVDCFSQ